MKGSLSLEAWTHICIIAISLSLALGNFDGTLFAWHPLLMSLGGLLFCSEGVLHAAQMRGLDSGPERVAAIQGHALLQVRSLVCFLLGFAVIARNKVGCPLACRPSNHFIRMATVLSQGSSPLCRQSTASHTFCPCMPRWAFEQMLLKQQLQQSHILP
jgi:hypothetical protein